MLLTIAALCHGVIQVEVASNYLVLNLEPPLAKLLFLSTQKVLPLTTLKTHSCIGVSQYLDHRELVCLADKMLSINNIYGNRGLWGTERVKFIPFRNLNAPHGDNL